MLRFKENEADFTYSYLSGTVHLMASQCINASPVPKHWWDAGIKLPQETSLERRFRTLEVVTKNT